MSSVLTVCLSTDTRQTNSWRPLASADLSLSLSVVGAGVCVRVRASCLHFLNPSPVVRLRDSEQKLEDEARRWEAPTCFFLMMFSNKRTGLTRNLQPNPEPNREPSLKIRRDSPSPSPGPGPGRLVLSRRGTRSNQNLQTGRGFSRNCFYWFWPSISWNTWAQVRKLRACCCVQVPSETSQILSTWLLTLSSRFVC